MRAIASFQQTARRVLANYVQLQSRLHLIKLYVGEWAAAEDQMSNPSAMNSFEDYDEYRRRRVEEEIPALTKKKNTAEECLKNFLIQYLEMEEALKGKYVRRVDADQTFLKTGRHAHTLQIESKKKAEEAELTKSIKKKGKKKNANKDLKMDSVELTSESLFAD